MSAALSSAVAAIWQAMGLAPPPGPLPDRHDFTVEDTDLILRTAPDGRTVTLEGTLGQLSADPREAAAQMRKLLRLGLGLTAFNRAALCLPDLTDTAPLAALADRREGQPPLRVAAVARIAAGDARLAVAAMEDIMQWRSFARDVIPRHGTADDPAPQRAADPDPLGSYVIFQP